MIDIDLLRKNPDFYRQATTAKGYNPDVVDKVLKLDAERRQLIPQVEELRQKRNALSEQMADAAKRQELAEEARKLKQTLQDVEPRLKKVNEDFEELLLRIPNPAAADVPAGQSDKDNKVVKEWGKKPGFDFPVKDHLELATALEMVDFARAAKVSGNSFVYLKNDGALLELALINYGLNFLKERGFTPIITPDLARQRYYLGTGYLPSGPEAQTYKIEDSDLGLIATAEVTLAGYHADEVLPAKDLPLKYAGYSHCFRREEGSYGKYSKGLYRMHQFRKVEMFMYTTVAGSEKAHQEILALEEEFWQSLEIPYRVLEMCTADLGAQAVKKYDLEAWLPGRKDYGEITSTSNTTDYQARRLNIKYSENGETKYAHTLNGTLMATSRAPIAILENFQQKDGSVKVPTVLQPYLGKKIITPKSATKREKTG